MGTQLVRYTSETFPQQQIAWAGPDDGGIRRGDREDTGDNEAAPDQLGYEPANPAVGDEIPEARPESERDYEDGMK